MATSTKTFDQVKSILGKLDQRIDALRNQRITGQTPVPAPTPNQGVPVIASRPESLTDGPNLSTVIGAGSQERGVSTPSKAAPIAPTLHTPHTPPGPISMADATARPIPPTSKYGRATPLRNIG